MPHEQATATAAWRQGRAGSGVTSRLILSYLERRGGREAVERVLSRAGLESKEQQLRDENTWFSFEQKIRLWEEIGRAHV